MGLTAPFEIVVGPAQIWLGPASEAEPAIDATPTGNWVSLGRTDGGVTVTHGRSTNMHSVDQSALPVKETMSERTENIQANLAEITPERYAKILDGASVSETAASAGVAGFKKFNLGSNDLPSYALLVRGPSPVMDGNAQYYYPLVHPAGDVKAAYSKENKVVLPVEYHAMENPSSLGTFGTYTAQTAAAQ